MVAETASIVDGNDYAYNNNKNTILTRVYIILIIIGYLATLLCATTDLTMRNQTCESQAVSMAMAMQWYTTLCPLHDANGAHPGLHWKPLDAAIR
jgi:hypothetical protein